MEDFMPSPIGQPPVHVQTPVDTAFNLAEDDSLQDSPDVELNPANLTPSTTLDKPYEGMFFDTLKEVEDYYEDYGRQQGFWTRIRSSYKSKQRSDDVTSRLYVCVHEGKHEPNAPPETSIIEKQDGKNKGKRTGSTIKSGCPVCFRITFDKYHLNWKVTGFNDNHNHKPITPCKRMKMKCNRHMPTVVKDLTEAFHRENLRVSKLPSIFGGATLGFDKRDCYNHLRDVRHRELEMGDAQAVLNNFRKRQAENPQFYYSMQCDDNGRATNFFWVDARSRMSYQYFGDVITFDTTYRTNKYDMPFTPFTGVNHHSQTIQFGCALLQDETEESFLWLFETWLEAMGGKPPTSIITDQDLAIKGTIAKKFSNSRHRLCLWHIKKKFVEKLPHVYYTKSTFKKAMKTCLHQTYTESDFEEQWKHMMIEYNLEGNEWLLHLYEIRTSWVPVYNRTTFFAGMNTTGRSEGINAFFDDFVTSTTNLKEFVLNYEQTLKRLVQRESDEDFESEHKNRLVKQDEFLLRHAAKIYTRTIFKKFKDEWETVYMYRVEELDHDVDRSFKVLNKANSCNHQFLVKLNMETLAGTCRCKHFEFTGLICRYIMKVLVRQDVDNIPEQFILARWRKEANKFRGMDSTEPLRDCDGEHGEALRLNHMVQESTKLACLPAPSKQRYLKFMDSLKELSKNVFNEDDGIEDTVEVTTLIPDVPEPLTYSQLPQIMLLDPNISQTKGRNKEVKAVNGKRIAHGSSSRIKSGLELNLEKKKKQCKCCFKFVRHDKQNCPQNKNHTENIIITEDGGNDQDEQVQDMTNADEHP